MTAGKFSWPQPIDGLDSCLQAVDGLMLRAVEKDRLGQAAVELINGGGKRLRPAIALTAAGLEGQADKKKATQTAAAIELVHLASLVHDDLLDQSAHRRNKPAAAAVHGPGFAVLLGDYLLAAALSLAAEAGAEIAKLIAETIVVMSEGEALELAKNKRPTPLSEAYFELISRKTASLFAAAAAAGGLCGKAPRETTEALRKYGGDFGGAFQLVDDIQDGKITSSQKTKALLEINRCNTEAIRSLNGMTGAGADSLRALPQAYLNWASPL